MTTAATTLIFNAGPREARVLVVGDAAAVPGLDLAAATTATDAAAAYELVLALPGAGDLFDRLAEHDRLLTPIADCGADLPRADWRGNEPASAVAQAWQATADLRRRVATYPPGTGGRSPRLTVLALARTRPASLAPVWDPARRELVTYPALLGLGLAPGALADLADAGLLTRDAFFDRTHVCAHCASARLVARDTCPDCASPHLLTEDLLHHYRCAWQAPRSAFRAAAAEAARGDLVCPKCRRTPRHYGVDYDAAGTVSTCRACGAWSGEPLPAFRCLDCDGTTPGAGAGARDWYSYTLTDAGRRAAETGRLPEVALDRLLAGTAGSCTPRELALLVDWSRRLHARYGNPFALVTVSISGLDTATERERVLTFVADTVRELIRDTDAIAALGDVAYLHMPETGREGAETVRGRIQHHVDTLASESARITVAVHGPETAGEIVDLLAARPRGEHA